jgi:hypothetical protein
MALKLVDLGTDVNCKDSVGGEQRLREHCDACSDGCSVLAASRRRSCVHMHNTHTSHALTCCAHAVPMLCACSAGTAMHHAAMANKKDMMFALARLGCDWRARADGIDGATASFVLCGQHGKTTRQQVRPLGGRVGGVVDGCGPGIQVLHLLTLKPPLPAPCLPAPACLPACALLSAPACLSAEAARCEAEAGGAGGGCRPRCRAQPAGRRSGRRPGRCHRCGHPFACLPACLPAALVLLPWFCGCISSLPRSFLGDRGVTAEGPACGCAPAHSSAAADLEAEQALADAAMAALLEEEER